MATTTQTFGDMEFYQQKKQLQARLNVALLALAKKVRDNPVLCEKIDQFRRGINPIEGIDDSRLPAGELVKRGFICRTPTRQSCLLTFLRFVVEEWWRYAKKEREEFESVMSVLDVIVEKYHDPTALKVIGTIGAGFTFDVVAGLNEIKADTEGDADGDGSNED